MAKPEIPYGYNEDGSIDHGERLFCNDENCLDKQDQERLATLGKWIVDGLVTLEDVANIYQGKTV